MRQTLRAPRKSWLRRQFLNSLRSNRRNCHPPSPAFSSCGPSCSNKSLKYKQCRRSLSRSLALLHRTSVKFRNPRSNPLATPATPATLVQSSYFLWTFSVFLCYSELRLFQRPRKRFFYLAGKNEFLQNISLRIIFLKKSLQRRCGE